MNSNNTRRNRKRKQQSRLPPQVSQELAIRTRGRDLVTSATSTLTALTFTVITTLDIQCSTGAISTRLASLAGSFTEWKVNKMTFTFMMDNNVASNQGFIFGVCTSDPDVSAPASLTSVMELGGSVQTVYSQSPVVFSLDGRSEWLKIRAGVTNTDVRFYSPGELTIGYQYVPAQQYSYILIVDYDVSFRDPI